ncbi:MBL fold metallo-hydrolase [Virgibacillus alimentarius]|uniref:Glyoxylase-like metal-dependent hydrolase (Beta-lactamase superfamily II) n=1 Tax=Virgibacillus alimentarius TaxID=698769 RepID=A0ABS4S805_9BACI|nr:MBL fold metallo-hydrolase [Virgibacillus alimentarius]MBP2257206.1 glyoxylase-like metal-dependent hydrolase (beta-lactamase superfamily II) [Virgibacillus alimentarius]
MREKEPIYLGNRIHLIDGFDMGIPARTGTYVIDEEALTLVETGPSPSIKYVKKGLTSLGFSLNDVKYIIVTHIHLDHSGGAGVLLKDCPNATVVVHPRGARHLVDPKKLAAGARAVYGDSFEELFEPILPIPEDRLLIKGEGDTLQIGTNCTLEFMDTPGHSRHHFSIFDPLSNGIFVGDTVGVYYKQLAREGIDLFLPSTSPNHFDPDAMHTSIERIRNMNVDKIYYGHFGMTDKVNLALNQASKWIDEYVELGEQAIEEGKGYDELSERMLQRVRSYLKTLHVSDKHDVYVILNLDMKVCALGLIDYFQKLKRQ